MINWTDIINYAKKGNLSPEFKIEKTKEEWKNILSEEQFRITREKGTERAGTGEFCESHQEGVYACVCCNTNLFDSTIKFSSGTGWPSFTQPYQPNAVSYIRDISFGMERIEALCNTCDAHLGHVFPDGPAPSGLRYCINSAAIQIVKK